MRFDKALRSKVAWRIFWQFILCALIPIICMATLSFYLQSDQRREQMREELDRESRLTVQVWAYRLATLKDRLRMLASSLSVKVDAVERTEDEKSSEHLAQGFRSLSLLSAAGEAEPLFGSMEERPELTQKEKAAIDSDETVLKALFRPDQGSRLFLARLIDTREPAILMGEIDATYLQEDAYPEGMEWAFLDESYKVLDSSLSSDAIAIFHAALPPPPSPSKPIRGRDQFEWELGSTEYVASIRSRRFTFLEMPRLTWVLSKPQPGLISFIVEFQGIFLLVTLTSLCFVLILSISQIRKILVPLAELHQGARRLAGRQFDTRVEIRSGDEFQDLGNDFNFMGEQLEKHIEGIKRFNKVVIKMLARTIDAISPWTLDHSERGAEMALKIGRALELSEEELEDLHDGAYLHDIGKLYEREFFTYVDKKRSLTESEMQIMRAHPTDGKRILEPGEEHTARFIPVVSQHHEWFDGGGYPLGISGKEISIGARILAVADVYDALTSDRPYRKGMDRAEAIDYIREKVGQQFDPEVVEAFLKVMAQEEKEPVSQQAS